MRAEVFPIWHSLWIGYKAVYQHAQAVESQRVYWQTHETNVVARRLCDCVAKNSGFVIYQKAM